MSETRATVYYAYHDYKKNRVSIKKADNALIHDDGSATIPIGGKPVNREQGVWLSDTAWQGTWYEAIKDVVAEKVNQKEKL